jgi:hypothetical protein
MKTNRLLLLRKISPFILRFLRGHQYTLGQNAVIINVKVGVSCGYHCTSNGYKGGEHLSCCATEQTIRSCGAANAACFIRSRQHKIQFPISAKFLPDRELSSHQGLYNRKQKKYQRVPTLATNSKVYNFNFLRKPEKPCTENVEVVMRRFPPILQACVTVLS